MSGALADRHLDWNRIGTETIFDFAKHTLEVGSFAIEFVDESESRHVVTVGLSPNGFALSFDAFSSAEHNDRTIEHSQTTFDFGGEVNVAGRIEQVYADVLPVKRHASRIDRDPTVLFFRVVVGGRVSTVDFSNAMLGSGEK